MAELPRREDAREAGLSLQAIDVGRRDERILARGPVSRNGARELEADDQAERDARPGARDAGPQDRERHGAREGSRGQRERTRVERSPDVFFFFKQKTAYEI